MTTDPPPVDPLLARPSFDPAVLADHGFPTISYDALVIGETFRSDDRLIRPQDIEAYAFAVEDHDPWFFGPSPFGGPIAHPTLLANQALFLRHSRYVVPAGLHARMRFEFLAPIPLGTRARTTGVLIDTYMRRDKPYMVTGFETADEAGTALVRGSFVQMLFREETAPAAGSAAPVEPEAPVFDPATRSCQGRHTIIAGGRELASVSRLLEQRQIDVYSGVRPGSIHTDPSWARAKGFPTTIAQGMMSTAYVSAMMTDAFGAGFIVGGTMDVRFLRPVFEGRRLTTSGHVMGFVQNDDGLQAHVEVAVHDDQGARTLAGTATARVTPTET
jgi:acyl dehydratase